MASAKATTKVPMLRLSGVDSEPKKHPAIQAKLCQFPPMASTTSNFTLLLLSLSFTFFKLFSASTETDALLDFRASIEDPKHALSSWSNTSSLHHCNWTGIACIATPSLYVSSITLQSLNLSGDISPSICQLPYLSHLNLADNLFNQPIPLHLSQCSSLEILNLRNNLIWGTIPDQVSQFDALRVLDLSRNHIEGKIPENIGSLTHLEILNLGSNLLSGSVPSVFGNFGELVVLDLSQNGYLDSELPVDIGELKKLGQLFLQGSGFHGEIPESLLGLENLTMLDLSQNNLTGKIPQTLGSSLKNLLSFDISENRLSGSFPSSICDGKGIINLSLHSNFFNGPIPNSISECSNLERFQVQDNGFSGDFPNGLWSLPRIKIIRAENNRFSGGLPDSISLAARLEQVQIDNNSFTGKIPNGLGLLKNLYRFSASLNGFYGGLSPNFCDSPVMSIINLSHNSLSGQIPELRTCRKLVSLSLAGNSLTGEIPHSLAELPVLTYLDLSDNNLTGSIPQELQNLKLALFNVSYNQLSGVVPQSLISGLPASFLEGNPGLCGPGLANSCSDGDKKHHVAGLTTLTCALIAMGFVVSISIVAAGFFVFRQFSRRKSQAGAWRSVFFYPLRVTENALIMGMNEKSAVGTGGPFGRVYILTLPSGEPIAIKKLVNFGCHSSKALKAEIKTLAKIRHKNIVKVLGFCCSDESVFLIYEFLQKGSLGDLICRPNFQLEWSVRLSIAIGVAQGLAYIHKDYLPHLLHRNLKSKNILLDADFEPKLTDFALDRIVGEAAFQSTLTSESEHSCYNAPEYAYSKKATEQMDVYSFGVVLLELLTGRTAEGAESSPDSLDIVKWVRRRINITNGAVQVLDIKISSSSQHEMLGALEIAVQCTAVMPEKRPSMIEVVQALKSLSSRNRIPNWEVSTSKEYHVSV